LPDEIPDADPSVTRWSASVGFALLLGAVSISLLVGDAALLVTAMGFVGTILIALGLLRGPHPGRWPLHLATIALAFGAYAHYLFDGYGRIILGSLGFGLVVVLAQRTRGRLVKLAVLLCAAPVLLILAKLRVQTVEGLHLGLPIQENGLESVVSPLNSLVILMNLNEAGLLPQVWGHTFWSALVALVPRGLWPDKPIGLGAELVPILSPHMVGTGHSEAALFFGEWLFNFGLPGLLLIVPVAGLVVRGIDRLLARVMSSSLNTRGSAVRYTAGIVAAVGLIDLNWVGTFSYAARTGSRMLVLAALVVLLALSTEPASSASAGKDAG
jgi:hypothetical protein